MSGRPNPIQDVVGFLTGHDWTTLAIWLLLVASTAISVSVWRRDPGQRSAGHIGIWLLRLIVGVMWWQQSLWKIPTNYDGLIYWMKQMVDHASTTLQSDLVDQFVLPHIAIFGPLVYFMEVAIGISLILGLLTRLGAILGTLMAVNLWLGLYSAPGEWPWTYFFLIVIQVLFVVDSPGQSLGADALIGRRVRLLLPAGPATQNVQTS